MSGRPDSEPKFTDTKGLLDPKDGSSLGWDWKGQMRSYAATPGARTLIDGSILMPNGDRHFPDGTSRIPIKYKAPKQYLDRLESEIEPKGEIFSTLDHKLGPAVEPPVIKSANVQKPPKPSQRK